MRGHAVKLINFFTHPGWQPGGLSRVQAVQLPTCCLMHDHTGAVLLLLAAVSTRGCLAAAVCGASALIVEPSAHGARLGDRGHFTCETASISGRK